MRRPIALPLLFAWLVVLWIALWGDLSWANLLGGIAVALGVIATAAVSRDALSARRLRPVWAIAFLAYVLWSLVVSNVRLARDVLSVRPRTFTGIIAAPMRSDSAMIITAVANSITLTPGTITVDVVPRRPPPGGTNGPVILYVHAIYAHDPDAIRRDVRRLETLAQRAFGETSQFEAVSGELGGPS